MLPSILLFLGAIPVAALINWAIYNLAFFPTKIGPWCKAPKLSDFDPDQLPKNARPLADRDWLDAIPIFGWYRLRREAYLMGSGFWIRPLLIEIFFPILIVALYHFEIQGGLIPTGVFGTAKAPLGPPGSAAWSWGSVLTVQFFAHAILIALLAVATFIDVDERTIPDTITIPGTLLALLFAACFEHLHLFDEGYQFAHLQPASPWKWKPEWSSMTGLGIGLLCFSTWCFALADRRIILRRGFKKAVVYFFAGMVRHTPWKILLPIWLLGSFGIAATYGWLDAEHWQSLFSSLVGMLLGCSVIWSIRIVGGWALQQEAMGFGDVTLMAMVGAFLGWQMAWLGFFGAVLIGPVIVIAIVILTRDSAFPFGPYLVAGSILALVGWRWLWEICASRLDFLGPAAIWLFFGCLLLMGALLWIYRHIRDAVIRAFEKKPKRGRR